MNRPRWDAPRAAYLLTAALADNTAFGTDWVGYDESTQQDILTALGAQTRLALRMLRDKLGMEIEMDSGGMPDRVDAGIAEGAIAKGGVRSACGEAAVAARELIKPSPRPGAALECAHCREIVARTMCGLQIQAYYRLGFTSAMIAGTCRQSAGKAETPPRH